jgi:hypothetical protein
MPEDGPPSAVFGTAAVAADVANIEMAINTAPVEILCFMVSSRGLRSQRREAISHGNFSA